MEREAGREVGREAGREAGKKVEREVERVTRGLQVLPSLVCFPLGWGAQGR